MQHSSLALNIQNNNVGHKKYISNFKETTINCFAGTDSKHINLKQRKFHLKVVAVS